MACPRHSGKKGQPGGLEEDAWSSAWLEYEHMRGSTELGLEGCILGGGGGRKGIPVGENSMTKSSEVPRAGRSSRLYESRAHILESNHLGLDPGSITYSCGPWQTA